MAELNVIVKYNKLFDSPIIKLIHVKHGMCFGYYLSIDLWLLRLGIHFNPFQQYKPRFIFYLKEL